MARERGQKRDRQKVRVGAREGPAHREGLPWFLLVGVSRRAALCNHTKSVRLDSILVV